MGGQNWEFLENVERYHQQLDFYLQNYESGSAAFEVFEPRTLQRHGYVDGEHLLHFDPNSIILTKVQVGNGVLTFEESKTHFTLWCIEKSLLMIGSGLEENLLDPVALQILSNKELVAINQDPLGEAAKLMRRFTEEQYDIWAGNLSDSRTVLTVVNWSPVAKKVTVNLADAGIQSAVKARDVWEKTNLGALDGVYTAEVAGHGVKLLVLEQTTPAGTYINRKYTAAKYEPLFPHK